MTNPHDATTPDLPEAERLYRRARLARLLNHPDAALTQNRLHVALVQQFGDADCHSAHRMLAFIARCAERFPDAQLMRCARRGGEAHHAA